MIQHLSAPSPLTSLHPPQCSTTRQREPVLDQRHAGHPREAGSSGVKALGSISLVQCNKIFYDIFTILCNGILRPQKKTLCKSKMELSGASPAGTSLSLFLHSLAALTAGKSTCSPHHGPAQFPWCFPAHLGRFYVRATYFHSERILHVATNSPHKRGSQVCLNITTY